MLRWVKGGQFQQLTETHRATSNDGEVKRIEKAGGKVHNGRVKVNLPTSMGPTNREFAIELTRSIGDNVSSIYPVLYSELLSYLQF